MKRALVLALAALATVVASAAAQSSAANWRRYDVNNDSRFDRADVQRIFANGLDAPAIDVNGDGKKNHVDAAELSILKTRWDANADGTVAAEDFRIAKPVVLPAADAALVARWVDAQLASPAPAIVPGLENKLLARWGARAQNADTLALLLSHFAFKALALGDLATAHWAYARGLEENPQRVALLAGFAFTLSELDRKQDALVTLATARSYEPLHCSVSANIAGVMTRMGRTQDALPFYQEAATNCPASSRYRSDLATAYLRLNNTASALFHYQKSVDRDGGNVEAQLMLESLRPAPVPSTAAQAGAYERIRNHPDGWTDRPAWQDLAPEEQVLALYEVIEFDIMQQLEKDRTQASLALNTRVEAIANRAAPQWQSACADMQRWSQNAQPVLDEIAAAIREATEAMRNKELAAYHRVGAQQMQAANIAFRLALPIARRRMVTQGSNGFAQTFDELYDEPIRRAQEKLQKKDVHGGMDGQVMNVAEIQRSIAFAPFSILSAAAADPEKYGKGCDVKPPEDSGLPADVVAGFSLPGVSLEYKFSSCEFKIQLGEGVMVATTWSPYAGWGAQGGLGFEKSMGFAKYGGAVWLKLGSDGRVVVEGGGGASIGGDLGPGLSKDSAVELSPAYINPVGLWPELGEILACDQPSPPSPPSP